MQGLQGLHHARMAGKRAQWLIGPHGCGRRGLRCGEGFGSGPPLAVGQPGPRRATDLLSSVIIRTLPLPLHSSDLRAKPVDLCPSALQLILKLYDSPLLLHQKAAAKRQL